MDIAGTAVKLGCGALGRHGRLTTTERGLKLDANTGGLFDEELAKEEETADAEEKVAASSYDRGIGKLGAVEQRALIRVGGQSIGDGDAEEEREEGVRPAVLLKVTPAGGEGAGADDVLEGEEGKDVEAEGIR